jgi:hypothetical protein
VPLCGGACGSPASGIESAAPMQQAQLMTRSVVMRPRTVYS